MKNEEWADAVFGVALGIASSLFQSEEWRSRMVEVGSPFRFTFSVSLLPLFSSLSSIIGLSVSGSVALGCRFSVSSIVPFTCCCSPLV